MICVLNTCAILIALRRGQRPTVVEEEHASEEHTLFGSQEVQEINRSFDERIAEMQSEMYANSTPAPIYHPSQENLPHDSVKIAQKVEHEYAN